MYWDCTRLLPSAALANSEFAALVAVGSGLCKTENQKERADIQTISLMRDDFTVVKGSGAGQTWVFET